MKTIFLLLFPIIAYGQRDLNSVGCTIQSFKTTCLDNSKTISEIKYKYIPKDYSPAIIDKIYGRFEDLQQIFNVRNFKENKIDFTCNENVIYDDKNNVFYAQQKNDERKFCYLYNDGYNYEKRLIYKGTQNMNEIKGINLKDPKKYLLLYNKELEKDDNYEVTFNYYDPDAHLAYTFHQRGNEFDE